MDTVPLARATRSGITECVFRGSIAVVRDGRLIDAYGNPYVHLPMRSTAKPFIVQSLVKHNGIEIYDLSGREIAVMVSSHNGEAVHRETVLGILNKVGLSESALKCGTHEPYFDWILDRAVSAVPTVLHHNCSGKHAGTLMLCHLMGFPIDNYWEFIHPAQRLILEELSSILKISCDRIRIGVDGCGVPTYIVSLFSMADAYQQLIVNSNLASVRNAMIGEPYMVAGRERLESDIIESCGYLAKSGSEGIFCLAVPNDKIGIAIKIDSGSDSAAECVAVELLDKMGLINSSQQAILDKYRFQRITTSTHLTVGRYEPVF